MVMNIKFFDIQKQYEHYRQDIDAQIRTVIEEGTFIMGRQVQELEARLAEYAGVPYAIACASGTEAIQLALMALEVKPGDEIITTPYTFFATVESIVLLGAKPVFVDVRRDTWNIDPAQIRQAIGPRTRGIVAVNMFGQCADYDEINRIAKDHALFVIEDGAQSFGARYKGRMSMTLADIGCTSFFPAKPFGCYGDGGMVFTKDPKTADSLKSLRMHGCGHAKYEHERAGLNSRLDTLQAAILLAKFKHFPDELERRKKIAAYYTQSLKSLVETPTIAASQESVFAQYNVIVQERPRLEQHLKNQHVPFAVYYPKPLHLQPALSALKYAQGDFPNAEYICAHILALPMHAFLTQEEQDWIIGAVKQGLS